MSKIDLVELTSSLRVSDVAMGAQAPRIATGEDNRQLSLRRRPRPGGFTGGATAGGASAGGASAGGASHAQEASAATQSEVPLTHLRITAAWLGKRGAFAQQQAPAPPRPAASARSPAPLEARGAEVYQAASTAAEDEVAAAAPAASTAAAAPAAAATADAGAATGASKKSHEKEHHDGKALGHYKNGKALGVA